MVGGTTRRLPKWLTVGDEDKKKKKKKTAEEEEEEQKRTEENPTPPPRKNSVPPANNGTKRKKGNLFKHDDLSRATSGNRSKRKAKDVAFHDQILDEEEDALTVEDLVSIAREFVKGSEDSEPSMLLLSRISQPDGSSEKQFTSGETRACVGPTVNLTTEQTFPSFIRTGDPAQDMLNLFLGPLLMKPQGNQMDLDLMHEQQRQSHDDSREETIPPAKKKSSLKDRVSSLLD